MATIATAEVRIIADTRGFVTNLRRKLRSAFATLGNQLGDDIVERIDRRVSRRLNTVMNQSAKRAGASFTQAFNQALGQAGLSDSLNQQLSGTAARNGAKRAGLDVADAFLDGFGINIESAQALFNLFDNNPRLDSAAFFAGVRGGTQYSEGLFDALRDRAGRQMREALQKAAENDIPPIFRNAGTESAETFVRAFDRFAPDSLSASLGRAFNRFSRRQAEDAGERVGLGFVRGFIRALSAISGAFSSLLSAVIVRPLAALASVFGEMSSELLSVAGEVLAVVALLEALSGLLFALPAAVSVGGAAIATMIVPLKGIIEAFDTAGGPADEFEKSLEGLTPAAQSVVREFRAISPALTDLRLRAQAALFAELGGAITEVADNLLGPLSDGIESASGAFGRIIDQVTEFLAQSETADTVAAVFDALTEVFDAVAESTEPFLEGMRTLVDEFIPEIEELADPLSDMGDEFKEWAERVTESGEAMEAFDRGKDTLQEIFDIALDITGIFDAMFDAAEAVGIDALGTVADGIADIREEFESVEGQEALGGIFDALGRIAGVIGDVFGTLFEEIGELAPEIAEFFEEVGPPVQELIDNLSEGIQELLDSGGTDFFKDLAQALADIDWKEIGEDIGEFLGTLGPVLEGLSDILDGVVDVLEFIADLASFLNDIFSEGTTSKWGRSIGEFFDELLNTDEVKAWIKEFDEALVTFLTEHFPNQVRDGLTFILDIFRIFFTEHFPNQIRDGLQFIVDQAREFWEELKEGFQQLVDGLSTTIVDGFIGIGEGFTAGLDTIVTTVTTFVETTLLTWGNFFLGLKDSALLALQGIGLDITGFFDGTTGDFSGFQNGISEGWNAFWTGLKDFASSQLNLARDVISGILNGIKSIVSGFISNVKAGWDVFWNGLSSTVSGGMSAVRELVSGALDTLRFAFDGFKGQVEDIWNGLVSFLQGIADTVSGIVDRISGFVSSAIDAASNLGNIDLTPFANGGIVNGPTPALVGEAGREVIIPLTRPARAVELARHSGLIDLLAAQGVLAGAGGAVSGPAAPVVGEMHVHSQNADPDQVARKALRLIERRMGGRGLERTS